jgi:hypothetical protein
MLPEVQNPERRNERSNALIHTPIITTDSGHSIAQYLACHPNEKERTRFNQYDSI